MKMRFCDTVEPAATGFLKLNVYRHVQRTPVAGALVIVSKLVIGGYYKESGSGYYLATDTSDENGSVSVFELPVLTDENEMYNVSVRAQGFCPALIFSVPIYPDITTTYNVYLRDIGITREPNFYFILQPAIPGRGTDSP
jgi:hypothetical protein